MYVVADKGGGDILAFGLTPAKAEADLRRRKIHSDGEPDYEIYPCTPALYRRIKAEDKVSVYISRCRINKDGIAVRVPPIVSITRRKVSRRKG
jgi:hypothetical protein